MMLSGHGLPEIPEGGSVESLLKSRIRRRLQLVDYRNCVLARRLTEGSVCTNHREVRVRWWWPWLWRKWRSLSEILSLGWARDRDLFVTSSHQQWTVALLGILLFSFYFPGISELIIFFLARIKNRAPAAYQVPYQTTSRNLGYFLTRFCPHLDHC